MSKILIIEDEKLLAREIQEWFEHEKYIVETATNGEEALSCLSVYKFDAIILDWMLPHTDGLQICKSYRASGGKTPILMLTARDSLECKELGLDSGADDYLTKPFQMKELAARIRALIRRSSRASESPLLKTRGLELDPLSHRVTRNGEELHLEPKEFNLLEFLMRHSNRTFSAEALIERVWESNTNASSDTLRAYIKSIRKKIDLPEQDSYIVTVHGVGYMIKSG